MTEISLLPLAAVSTPTLSSVLVYAVGKRALGLGRMLTVLASALSLLPIALMYPMAARGVVLEVALPSLLPPLGVMFRVDGLGYLFSAMTSGVWCLVTIYAISYMKGALNQARFFAALLQTLGACLGVAMAGDLFTLFVFFEVLSLAAYVLIVHDQTQEAMRAGFKYLVMSVTGSLSLFFAVVSTYDVSGTLSLATRGIIPEKSGLTLTIFIAFLVGFGMKAGVFPLHVWLPDAHPIAPAPASALLSGIMIKAGAYGIIRVFHNVYGAQLVTAGWWPSLLLWASGASMVLGSGVAILQSDLKRRLAYSSIGQMGYILAGVSLASSHALAGSIFHVFGHALAKSCLFLCAGLVASKTGIKDVEAMAGVGRRMPVTMIAFTAAALSMVGIPPFNGFVSKWWLSLGAVQAGVPLLLGLYLACSMMACLYILPVVVSAFFGPEPRDRTAERTCGAEAPLGMLIPVAVLATGTVLFSLAPGNFALVLSRVWAEGAGLR
ncbi:MAG: monovalent cation/H+ antiporter subunit D family protein [Firmicutes bacterium]|nr:monovalent cation/H+ antiporter subunit D family protein [Bacillota bacterium]